jgi:monovalent cation/hydrogen antiporter
VDASVELFFGLSLLALVLAVFAKRHDFPYPVALVLGGIAMGLLPGIHMPSFHPQVVFFLLLPPVLAEAAYFTSLQEFLRFKRPIFLLAFGLVVATSAFVAFICVKLIPGMTWPLGFALGAIISPPDAAAATSILRGLRLPRRIVQILEGESLVNDAAGLTIYRFAVLAIVSGTFSWGEASLSFIWIVLGGIAVGLVLAALYVRIYPHIKDPDVEIISTFLLGYMTYLSAELMHASGVLACVTGGVFLGAKSSTLFSATTRIRAVAVWQSAIFVVNAVIFLMIGLQLPAIVNGLSGYSTQDLVLWSLLITVGVIVLRIGWAFLGAYLPRWIFPSIRRAEPKPNWQGVVIVGWTGLRGVISLAAAEALPEKLANGQLFPHRSLILFLSIVVILATLLVQGLTLRALIHWLKLPADRSSETEMLEARVFAGERVIERFGQLCREKWAPQPVMDRVGAFFADRLADQKAQLEIEQGSERPEQPEGFQTIAEQRVWWELARAERSAINQLRKDRKVSAEVFRAIEREVDLLEARIVPRTGH